MQPTTVPSFDLDLFADAVLMDPYPTFQMLRDAGPVVWLDRLQVYCCARYAEVRQVLENDALYISSKGVGFNDFLNQAFVGTIIQSDAPDHNALRAALGERLSPQGMKSMQERVQAQADALVISLKGRGAVDAVADLARTFPLSIVAELIGIPKEGRDRLLAWGEANFNVMGPENDRYRDSLAVFQECFAYITWIHDDPGSRLTPGGLGAALYEAAARGVIRRDQCPPLMAAYLVAGIDTTISSIASAVQLLGQHPTQFALLKQEPALVPRAYNEVLRIESPSIGFKRVLKEDAVLAGVPLQAGASVAVLYASANRDERKYPDPARFDIRRSAADHVAFGFGRHVCAGQALARLEATSILSALARHVDHIELGASTRLLNNTVRSLDSLSATFH